MAAADSGLGPEPAGQHSHAQRRVPLVVLGLAVAVLSVLVGALAVYASGLRDSYQSLRALDDRRAAQLRLDQEQLAQAQGRTRDALCATILDSLADEIPTQADSQLRMSYARLSCPTPLPSPSLRPSASAGSPRSSGGAGVPGRPPATAGSVRPGGQVTVPGPPAGPSRPPANQPTSQPTGQPAPAVPVPSPSCVVRLLGLCL